MFLLLTILCACIFLGVKYFEYSHKFEEGSCRDTGTRRRSPTRSTAAGTLSHGYATFFSFYFMMTGLHGIHILVGIFLLRLDRRARQSRRIFRAPITRPSTWSACTGTWST